VLARAAAPFAAIVVIGSLVGIQHAPAATPSTIFTRVQDAPVLQPSRGWYDDYMLSSPSVVRVGGVLYMVYTGFCQKPAGYTPLLPPARTCPGDAGIFLLGATSTDGVHWSKGSGPIIRPIPGERWMKQALTEAELVAGPDGWFYLFFTGNGPGSSRAIGVARSRAPFGPWDIDPRPILHGVPSALSGRHKVLAPDVRIEPDRDRVLMWFNGTNQLEFGWDVYAATSTWPLRTADGWSTWRFADRGQRAVVGPYNAGSGDPTVVVDHGLYHMFFTCGSPKFNGPSGICHATSMDGLHFELAPNLDALLPRSRRWDANLETPFVMPAATGGYMMWYLGYGRYGYRGASIGVAQAPEL